MPRETLRSQIDCVLSDIGADVVKTGMLPSAEVGSTVVASDCRGPLQFQLRRVVMHHTLAHKARHVVTALCHRHCDTRRGKLHPLLS